MGTKSDEADIDGQWDDPGGDVKVVQPIPGGKTYIVYCQVLMPVKTVVTADDEYEARGIAAMRKLDLSPMEGWAIAEEFYTKPGQNGEPS